MIKHSGRNVTAGILSAENQLVIWLLRDITYGKMMGLIPRKAYILAVKVSRWETVQERHSLVKLCLNNSLSLIASVRIDIIMLMETQESVVSRRTCHNAIIYSIARTLSK